MGGENQLTATSGCGLQKCSNKSLCQQRVQAPINFIDNKQTLPWQIECKAGSRWVSRWVPSDCSVHVERDSCAIRGNRFALNLTEPHRRAFRLFHD